MKLHPGDASLLHSCAMILWGLSVDGTGLPSLFFLSHLSLISSHLIPLSSLSLSRSLALSLSRSLALSLSIYIYISFFLCHLSSLSPTYTTTLFLVTLHLHLPHISVPLLNYSPLLLLFATSFSTFYYHLITTLFLFDQLSY